MEERHSWISIFSGTDFTNLLTFWQLKLRLYTPYRLAPHVAPRLCTAQ